MRTDDNGITGKAFNPANMTNFSGGPGVLPEKVLCEVRESIMEVPEMGLSILGISHRSDWFASVVQEVENNVRMLLGITPDYHVLLLQGGATQQFAMVPMTLCRTGLQAPEYLDTGYWSGKSVAEARRIADLKLLWSGRQCGYRELPRNGFLDFSAQAAYLHYVSNETVEGLQFSEIPGLDSVTRVCDMSSDFLSRPFDMERFALVYAHAQKNIGPAGVTVVVIHDDIVKMVPDGLPSCLDYRAQVEAHSILNTPPVFAIYVVMLVTRWLLQDVGGLERMEALNHEKARLLYSCIDDSDGFYRGHARPSDRSVMNVVFNLARPELEQAFLLAAHTAGLSGLQGHRSLGGLRASIYNAMTLDGVSRLANFMQDFRFRHIS